jgi:hypothetical protein
LPRAWNWSLQSLNRSRRTSAKLVEQIQEKRHLQAGVLAMLIDGSILM